MVCGIMGTGTAEPLRPVTVITFGSEVTVYADDARPLKVETRLNNDLQGLCDKGVSTPCLRHMSPM